MSNAVEDGPREPSKDELGSVPVVRYGHRPLKFIDEQIQRSHARVEGYARGWDLRSMEIEQTVLDRLLDERFAASPVKRDV